MKLAIPALAILLAAQACAQPLCGDCNMDGVVNVLDALKIAQLAAGSTPTSPPDFLVCDVDNDGDIDIIDALITAQFAAGIPVILMCVPPLPTTCMISSPIGGSQCGNIPITFDVASPNPFVDIDFGYSTDGGASFLSATATLVSPLTNPALGVTPGPGLSFIWQSLADLPALAANVQFRVCVDTTNCCMTDFDLANPCPLTGVPPMPGDLLITEVMQNPLAVSDANGEWFEIRSLAAVNLDLDGCMLMDNGADAHTVASGSPLILLPGDLMVFGINANPMLNGNVTVDYEYTSFFLGNADDEIIIFNPSMVEVVRIEYDGGVAAGGIWPDPDGASMNLDIAIADPAMAQDGANWCESTVAWSGADLGSPRTTNQSCTAGVPPSCMVSSPGGACEALDVNFFFDSVDPDSATLMARFDYSTDGGGSWTLCTTSGSSPAPYTTNPTLMAPPGVSQHFIWDSAADLGISYCANARVRVAVDDGVSSATCSSTDFLLASGSGPLAPACAIGAPAPASSVPAGDIDVDFTLTDADSSCLDVVFIFSTDGGITLAPATPAATSPAPYTTNPAVGAPGVGLRFVWDSSADGLMPGAAVLLRIAVDDCTTSSICNVSFTLAPVSAPPPAPGDFTFNEIHADPDPMMGDANGDGIISSLNDEFIELVNISGGDRNLSGYLFADAISTTHTFPAGTVIPSGRAVIVFGGGTPTGAFGGNVVQVASTGTLSLNNGGDTLTLKDSMGTVITTYAYGAEGGMDTSLVKDPEASSSPMSAGGSPMVLHDTIPAAGGSIYSPGTTVSGAGTW